MHWAYTVSMSIKHSIASKARQAKIPKDILSKKMAALATRKNELMSKKEKRALAMRMTEARLEKLKAKK